MTELANAGMPIDFVTLTESLAQRKELDLAGGTAYVTSLTDGLPRFKSVNGFKEYVDAVLKFRAK